MNRCDSVRHRRQSIKPLNFFFIIQYARCHRRSHTIFVHSLPPHNLTSFPGYIIPRVYISRHPWTRVNSRVLCTQWVARKGPFDCWGVAAGILRPDERSLERSELKVWSPLQFTVTLMSDPFFFCFSFFLFDCGCSHRLMRCVFIV